MSHTPRRIDHVVFAVHDLDAAGAFYQRLGFQVGPRNRHPWGTENRLIQFGSSFIELITAGAGAEAPPGHEPGRSSFGGFVRDYLSQGEGFAMLALASDDARVDAALFAREGIGAFEPFLFERKSRRPDGTETHVAFTLAFASEPGAPRAGFFVCQHHFPENFWNPALQRHENGASAIAEVGMIATLPQKHQAFLSIFSGSFAHEDERGRLAMEVPGSRLTVAPAATDDSNLQLHSLTVHIPDAEAQGDRLKKANISFAATGDGLRIAAGAAFGVTILFSRGPLN
ncbi:MAG: VOC family protein [Steroidobacteraceae bacterium]